MKTLALQKFGDASITATGDAKTMRDSLLAQAGDIVTIEDDFICDIAAGAMRELTTLSRTVEKDRKLVKDGPQQLCRDIDDCAKTFVSPVDREADRLNKLVTSYRDNQRKKAEESERVRQAELQRIEAERVKAEQAETKRLKDIADAQAASKAAAEAIASGFVTPEEEAEASAKVAQSQIEIANSEAAAAKARDAQALLKSQHQSAQTAVVRAPAKIEGLTERKVWKFEVQNIHNVYSHDVKLCIVTPSVSAINDAIKNGARSIPGMRIWQETKTEMR